MSGGSTTRANEVQAAANVATAEREQRRRAAIQAIREQRLADYDGAVLDQAVADAEAAFAVAVAADSVLGQAYLNLARARMRRSLLTSEARSTAEQYGGPSIPLPQYAEVSVLDLIDQATKRAASAIGAGIVTNCRDRSTRR